MPETVQFDVPPDVTGESQVIVPLPPTTDVPIVQVGSAPVPERAISLVGLTGSSDAIRRVVDFAPVVVGVNVADTVQLAAAAMVGVAPQVPAFPSPTASVNIPLSAPVRVMADTIRLPVPLFESVKVCAAEVVLVVTEP